MSARVWNLVQSQWPRELRRREWSFFQLIFLISVTAVLLGPQFSLDPLGSDISADNIGGRLLASLLLTQGMALAYLGFFRSADGKNDRTNGLYDILKLSGCSETEWLASRVLLMLPVFLTFWLLAMPFVAFATTLGGIGWTQVCKAELILLSTFLAVAGIGLRLEIGSTLKGMDGPCFLLIMMSVFTPPAEGIVGLLRWFSVPISTSPESVILFLGSCMPRSAGIAVIEHRDSAAQLTIACALPLLIAGYFLRSSCRELFTEPDDAPEAAVPVSEVEDKRESEGVPARTVSSTRAPDDPFAWQIRLLTSERKPIILWKGIAYAAVTALLLINWLTGWMMPGGGSVIVFSSLIGLSLVSGVAIPAGAFLRANREETLPLLLLTPRSGVEIYDGWARGARWLMIPELVIATVWLAIIVVLESGNTFAVAVTAVAAILSLGPLAALCSLLRGTFDSVVLLAVLLIAIGLIILVGVKSVDAFGMAALPATQIPLFVGLNRLCRGALSAHLEEKVQSSEPG